MYQDSIIAIIIGLIIFIGLFLLLRSFVLWYFKISQRAEGQQQIIELLTELVKQQAAKK